MTDTIESTPNTDALFSSDHHHYEDGDFMPMTCYIRMRNLSKEMERGMNSAINDRQVQYRILQRCRADRDQYHEDANRLRQQVHDLERLVAKLKGELTSALNEVVRMRLTTPPAVQE